MTDKKIPKQFVPSIFDDSTDDYFINKGMSELTEIGNQIKESSDNNKIEGLKELRKNKSTLLQQRLFDNYNFLNTKGETKNLSNIFEALGKRPPAAAGECAAPKLIQYALENKMELISIAEFWWGAQKGNERFHKEFYPACRDKCRPILEYILDDDSLFQLAKFTSI